MTKEDKDLPKINGYDILAYINRSGIGNHYTLGVNEFGFYDDESNGRRIDVFFFDRYRKETMGIEIKVSRQDFLSDKKWQEYLPYCSRFYFIAPAGVIRKEELPKEVGLIEVEYEINRWQFDRMQDGDELIEGIHYNMKHEHVKKCRKLHDLSPEVYTDILERLMMKMFYNRNLL